MPLSVQDQLEKNYPCDSKVVILVDYKKCTSAELC